MCKAAGGLLTRSEQAVYGGRRVKFQIRFCLTKPGKMATPDKFKDIWMLAKETDGGLTSEQVLARGVPWDSLGDVLSLNPSELALVKQYDKKGADKAVLLERVRSESQ